MIGVDAEINKRKNQTHKKMKTEKYNILIL